MAQAFSGVNLWAKAASAEQISDTAINYLRCLEQSLHGQTIGRAN
ncbi:hypothetical protein ACQ5SK_26115 [Bradyrhizobium japonicum]